MNFTHKVLRWLNCKRWMRTWIAQTLLQILPCSLASIPNSLKPAAKVEVVAAGGRAELPDQKSRSWAGRGVEKNTGLIACTWLCFISQETSCLLGCGAAAKGNWKHVMRCDRDSSGSKKSFSRYLSEKKKTTVDHLAPLLKTKNRLWVKTFWKYILVNTPLILSSVFQLITAAFLGAISLLAGKARRAGQQKCELFMFLLKARVLSLEPCLIEWICRDSFCSNPEPRPAKCHPGSHR